MTEETNQQAEFNEELNEEMNEEAPVNEEPVEEQAVNEVEQDSEEVDELSHLQEENDRLEDRILRLQAEIANMTRSHSRERQDLAKYRSQSLASKLLDVIDNLERALETEVTSEDGQALRKGVDMVYNQFIQAFADENIQVVNPINEEFNPNFHQAVTTAPVSTEHPENTVVQVLQKGYCIDSRVIRPAMVIVAQ